MFAPAASARTPSQAEHFSVKNGTLVRMKVVNGTTKTIPSSLSDVGHKLKTGAIIVDASDNPIPATKMHFKRTPNGHPQNVCYDFVFDPGPQYSVAFDPKAPPQYAMVYKI